MITRYQRFQKFAKPEELTMLNRAKTVMLAISSPLFGVLFMYCGLKFNGEWYRALWAAPPYVLIYLWVIYLHTSPDGLRDRVVVGIKAYFKGYSNGMSVKRISRYEFKVSFVGIPIPARKVEQCWQILSSVVGLDVKVCSVRKAGVLTLEFFDPDKPHTEKIVSYKGRAVRINDGNEIIDE